ncbi:MAG: hypothetical protein ACI4KM_03740 [Oscillospiraceae bacterium]
MSSKKTSTNNLIPLVSTIIVTVLALAAVIILMVTTNNKKPVQQTSSQVSSGQPFMASEQLIEECGYAAHDLFLDSYKVLRLYVIEGLAHNDEPYGNRPEDGIYTVNSSEYTELSQITSLVNSVFVEAEAERIITNIDGNGLAVYQNREIQERAEEPAEGTSEAPAAPVYVTKTVLGISEDFAPIDYKHDWSTIRIAVKPTSETECELTVYLDGVDAASLTDENKDSVLETKMIKNENGEWRLTQLVY